MKTINACLSYCCCLHFIKAISHSRLCITLIFPQQANGVKITVSLKWIIALVNTHSHWWTNQHANDRQKMQGLGQESAILHLVELLEMIQPGSACVCDTVCFTGYNLVHSASLDTIGIEVQTGVKHTWRWHWHLQSAQRQPIKRWSGFFLRSGPCRIFSDLQSSLSSF